jgi:hypothetical protein
MRWLSIAPKLLSRRIEHDLLRLWHLLLENPEPVVLVLGAALRLAIYLYDRVFWLDEISLWGNIRGKPIFDFSRPLAGGQLAPIGFLIAERALTTVLGPTRHVARLIPLLSGIFALGLFGRLARRILPRAGALLALVLFAFSDDLVYYSSEMKPYALDLAVGLALTLAALESLEVQPSAMRFAAVGTAALVAPWCSFGSAFIVAGCGATLIAFSLVSRRYRDAALWVAIGIGWLASFTAAFRASAALLGPATPMFEFWRFAFLPVAPLSPANLARGTGLVLETFVNPLNMVGPTWPWMGVVVPLSLLAAGGVSLARRSWPTFAILVVPVVLALIASAMQRYPFHGRLILELVPAFLLLVAEGSERLRDLDRSRARLVYRAVLVVLVAYPVLTAISRTVWHVTREYNSHGDLHNNLFIHDGPPARNPTSSRISARGGRFPPPVIRFSPLASLTGTARVSARVGGRDERGYRHLESRRARTRSAAHPGTSSGSLRGSGYRSCARRSSPTRERRGRPWSSWRR